MRRRRRAGRGGAPGRGRDERQQCDERRGAHITPLLSVYHEFGVRSSVRNRVTVYGTWATCQRRHLDRNEYDDGISKQSTAGSCSDREDNVATVCGVSVYVYVCVCACVHCLAVPFLRALRRRRMVVSGPFPRCTSCRTTGAPHWLSVEDSIPRATLLWREQNRLDNKMPLCARGQWHWPRKRDSKPNGRWRPLGFRAYRWTYRECIKGSFLPPQPTETTIWPGKRSK